MDDEEFDQVLDYFEDNYIGRVVRKESIHDFQLTTGTVTSDSEPESPERITVQKVLIAFLATLLWTLSIPLYTNF